MAMTDTKKLHWTQRIALVRHNLHSAARSGNFGFFRALQAYNFVEGTNHTATLSTFLGEDADITLSAIDNLNSGLALAYQNAFERIHVNVKQSIADDDDRETTRLKFLTDLALQTSTNDTAIDRLCSSAVALINDLPSDAQEHAANVWITGVTIVADSVEVVLQQTRALGSHTTTSSPSPANAVYRQEEELEESRNIVKAAVCSAVTGLKGVFSLMDLAVLPNSGDGGGGGEKAPARTTSIASAGSAMLRKLSNAFSTTTTAPTTPVRSRNSSGVGLNGNSSNAYGNTSGSQVPGAVAVSATTTESRPVYRMPNYARRSVDAAGRPTSMPAHTGFDPHALGVLPATPMGYDDDELDPFDRGGGVAVLPPPSPRAVSPLDRQRVAAVV